MRAIWRVLKPDGEIFEEIDFSIQTLVTRMRETAFLTRGLRIVLVDEREGEDRHEFYAEGGIRDFVAFVNEEPPFFKTSRMGSVVYANATILGGATVVIEAGWRSGWRVTQ